MTDQIRSILRKSGVLGLAFLIALAGLTSAPAQSGNEPGFQKIFNGKNLDGWTGNPEFWSVENGVIVGETTDNKPSKNTFLIWKKAQPTHFELKLEFKIHNHNSGIQYRSSLRDGVKYGMTGYQADIDKAGKYIGANYDEKKRGMLANRGEKTLITEDGNKKKVGTVGDPGKIKKHINLDGWNTYHIIAYGNHVVHKINGHVTSEVLDRQQGKQRRSGYIGFQLHTGPAMKMQFRNIRLKRLPAPAENQKKKVVFVAGTKSHGFAAHEHKAGCLLLAESLDWNQPGITTEVVTGGWPDDPSVFEGADSIVMFNDGGGGHMVNDHLDQVQKLVDNGVGVVALHYGVEVPKGKPGQKFLNWIGGYFEAHWSVNPHWTAKFEQLPNHPVTAGVKPFAIHDEWYYHMRFRKDREGLTSILRDTPSPETITDRWKPGNGSDSHHGNKAVYKAVVKNQKPQHLGWAYRRPDGGRGFGFTGGHFHWNWGHDQFRKVVLNAIAWTAHAKYPNIGIYSETPGVPELLQNQDYGVPGNFDPAKIRKKLEKWNN